MTTQEAIYVVVVLLIIAVISKIEYSRGYHKGRRKGLHDGWVLAQGGKISPGLSPIDVWEMPMVFDGIVYRDGKIEQEVDDENQMYNQAYSYMENRAKE